MLVPDVRIKGENAPKSIAAGALPQTTPKELMELPQYSQLDLGGLLIKEEKEEGRGEKKKRGGKGGGPPCVAMEPHKSKIYEKVTQVTQLQVCILCNI